MKCLALIFATCAMPAFANCPDPSRDAPRYSATGPELISPQSWEIEAHGLHAAPCALWAEVMPDPDALVGYLPVAPTAQFELSGMAPHIMMVMAQAECRPVLAVRTGDGMWSFGETANGRQEIVLWGAPDGMLQVWVGSAQQGRCDAIVTLETFDR